jgi:hypothetical protein
MIDCCDIRPGSFAELVHFFLPALSLFLSDLAAQKLASSI